MTLPKTQRVPWPMVAGLMMTAVAALVAITVQWGVVTTKLDNVEKRLDEMIFEARGLRQEYQSIERRLSVLEGRSQAQGSAAAKEHSHERSN